MPRLRLITGECKMNSFVGNQLIVLRFSRGTNKKTGERQWQAQVNGVLYVLHRACEEPSFDGQKCDCTMRFKIADTIVVVSVEKYYESNNQKKRQHRQAQAA